MSEKRRDDARTEAAHNDQVARGVPEAGIVHRAAPERITDSSESGVTSAIPRALR
jgi:hypothetical protein